MSGAYSRVLRDRNLTGKRLQVYLEHIFYCAVKLGNQRQTREGYMHSGMLWYDNGPQGPLEDRLLRAVGYYRKKYGRRPTLCLVNQTTMQSLQRPIEGITVRAYRPMLPGHFWIGVDDEPAAGRLRANGHRKGHRLTHVV
jgi:hypothetical protein